MLVGETVIYKWKYNRKTAYSLCADDSSSFHLEYMIPEMKKYNFVGTFWVNPGCETWKSRIDEWLDAVAYGNDLANHTMHHRGAKTYEEAEYEISAAASIIREAAPNHTLLLFQRGGATVWDISEMAIAEILAKNVCIDSRGKGLEQPGTYDSPYYRDGDKTYSVSVETSASYPDLALTENRWHMCKLHHVGPGATNLPMTLEAFVALLQAMDKRRHLIWVDTHTNIHKYVVERDAAELLIKKTTDEYIIIGLTTGLNIWMYNYPLMLETKVPSSWKKCTINHNNSIQLIDVKNNIVIYEALPDRGDIVIKPV